ncbi:unnamed protein product, partial [Effrenium voratum]
KGLGVIADNPLQDPSSLRLRDSNVKLTWPSAGARQLPLSLDIVQDTRKPFTRPGITVQLYQVMMLRLCLCADAEARATAKDLLDKLISKGKE